MERREAPRRCCETSSAGRYETRPHAKLPGPKCFGGSGGPGARGPLRGARAPLGAPSRHALSAAAPRSVVRRRYRRRLRLNKA